MPVREFALVLDTEAAAGPEQVRRDDPGQFPGRLSRVHSAMHRLPDLAELGAPSFLL